MELTKEAPVKRPEAAELEAADEPCTAELAECNCPEFCERDHDNE